MAFPHQFSERAASMSARATRGAVPSRFRIENVACCPEAKWLLCARHSAHSSEVAQPPAQGR